MMLAALPDLLSAPPSASATPAKPGDGQAFAGALAGAIDRDAAEPNVTPAEPDDPPSDEDAQTAGEAIADPTLALLLAGLALANPAPEATRPGETDDTTALSLNLSVTDPTAPAIEAQATLTALPADASPTVGELAALVQALADEDALSAQLVVEPLASLVEAPSVELTLVSLAADPPADPSDERPEQRAIEPAAEGLAERRDLPVRAEAPAAPMTPTRAEPERQVEPRQLVEQVVPRLTPRLEKAGEFRITLQPESLGTIDVAIRVSPAGVQIQLAADDTARDLLQSSLAELKSALRPTDGRELAIDVSPRLGGGFDPNNPFHRGNAVWTPPPRPGRPVGRPEEQTTPAARMTSAPAGAGRIDYRI